MNNGLTPPPRTPPIPHDHHDHDDHAPIVDTGAGDDELLEIAIRELLIEKGVLTAAQVNGQIDAMDSRNPALGAKVIARAWSNPEFKVGLIESPLETIDTAFGMNMSTPLELVVLENTPQVHNVVVCTLCSCYPRMLLGIPPAWYKATAYRSRVVSEPRVVLAEFGLTLPAETEVRVSDSTADLRYLVLPMRPVGTDEWPEERLAALVSRDCMIGTGVPAVP
jgi:nitrile hydratase